MQHVALLVVVWRENDVDHDVFQHLDASALPARKHSVTVNDMASPTHIQLFRLVRLDLLCIPHFLIRAARLEIVVLLQGELDDEVVVAQFQVLWMSAA